MEGKMKRLLMTVLVLAISVFLLAGCGGTTSTTPAPTATQTSPGSPTTSTSAASPTPTPTTQAPQYGGTLNIIIIGGPQTAGGWPVDVFGPDATSYQFCMEPLLHSTISGEPAPWLAESYQVANDLMSITFKLKKGVKFQDGTDFNAQAAKWNLDNHITGMSSYAQYWDSVDVIDDYTIRVNLKSWTNTVLSSFADSPGSWMVSPTAFEQNGVDWMRDNPVGTGPFKFVSFQRDVNYKVVKNTDYWIKDRPYLDGIEIKYIADPMTQQAAMQAGEADMLELEPGKMAKDLETLGLSVNFQIVTVYTFFPDSAHADSPYADQKVREAIGYAIDREALANVFSYGYWDAPYQIPPTSNPAYNPNFTLGRKYDPTKSRALLTEAGHPNGFQTTILVNPAIVNRDIPVALQSNLADVGITAELSYPANMGGFIADSNSLTNVLVIQPVLASPNFNSTFMFFMGPQFMWNNNFLPPPEFLAAREVSLASPQMDVNLIRAATDILSEQASVIPLMQAGLGWAMQKNIMGGGFFERGSSSYFDAAEVWLKP
jgi:peptide/nickel transport system substrate-binding protein